MDEQETADPRRNSSSPAPKQGSLRERLVELLACKSAAMEQTPLHKALFAWLGSTPTAEADAATSDADSSAVESLRARVPDHYRQPCDQILDSTEGRTELDPTVVTAQLLGPSSSCG